MADSSETGMTAHLHAIAPAMQAELASAARGRPGWRESASYALRMVASWTYVLHENGACYHGSVIGNGRDGWSWSLWLGSNCVRSIDDSGVGSAAEGVVALECAVEELRSARESADV